MATKKKLSKKPRARKKSSDPRGLPVVPLRDLVVFPNVVMPLFIGRDGSLEALETAMKGDRRLCLLTQRSAAQDEPGPEDLYEVGCLVEVLQVFRLGDGATRVLVDGKARLVADKISLRGEVLYEKTREVPAELDGRPDSQTEALMRSVMTLFEEHVKLSSKLPPETAMAVAEVREPGRLADAIASNLQLRIEEKQRILATLEPIERLEVLAQNLGEENAILSIEQSIQGRVKKQMEKSQRDYYLQEQMKAIRKELGKGDDDNEAAAMRKRLKALKLDKELTTKVGKEIDRLEKTAPLSAEATVIRTWLELFFDLPWNQTTKDSTDIAKAARILEEDHDGLKKPKDRILEYLAVKKLSKGLRGPILCLAGPPGVGKTSLARSIARALGRKFERVSLGGVRDEAEIRGHRKTYIGAMPGRIIQGLKRAGTKNPVLLLNELDKMSMDFRGDPSAALLEVLDPEQNGSFVDHYLDAGFDLSQVLFITTANVLYEIPAPLRDRLEVIELAGYTDEEKLGIARRFLLPRQMKENGINEKNLKLGDKVLRKVIRRYTREAGVRNLERRLGALCRKAARKVVEAGKDSVLKVTEAGLHGLLGSAKYGGGDEKHPNAVGVATGLAWTGDGGDILAIEVTPMKGKGDLILTGTLGDVMKESGQAALSWVRARARRLGLPEGFYRNQDLHIHIPEGATPKDGPSAGVTLVTAMVSALTGRAVREGLAMTGEMTLSGKVLAIGGLKEKALAARRAGINTILVPRANEKDLEDIPASVRKAISFKLVSTLDQVLKLALEVKPMSPAKRRKMESDAPDVITWSESRLPN